MKKLLIILLSALSLTAVAQQQADVKRVAILETVDKMGTVGYLKLLQFRSNLTSAVTNTDGYEGYDRVDLGHITGEQNFQRTGMVSDADIKKIGEFTGAQYVLIAEATIEGTDMFITAKIIDVETARILRNSNQLMGTSATEMQTGSQKVAEDLLIKSEQNNNTLATNASSTNKAYIDLGLPSGTLWKSKNERGLYTYEEAMDRFGSQIPTKSQLVELINYCKWEWTGSGYRVIGRNGNYILLKALGYSDCSGITKDVGNIGNYWSSLAIDRKAAYGLDICNIEVKIHNYYYRCYGRSVILVK